jgi:hypothetical protein
LYRLKIGKPKSYYNSTTTEPEFKESELTIKEFTDKRPTGSRFYLKMIWKNEADIDL